MKALVHFTNVTELNARGEADVVHLDDPFFTIEARCEESACGWDIRMHIYILAITVDDLYIDIISHR